MVNIASRFSILSHQHLHLYHTFFLSIFVIPRFSCFWIYTELLRFAFAPHLAYFICSVFALRNQHSILLKYYKHIMHLRLFRSLLCNNSINHRHGSLWEWAPGCMHWEMFSCVCVSLDFCVWLSAILWELHFGNQTRSGVI
jgi:hypothetical protein